MKVKTFLLVTFFLAAASLGLALQPTPNGTFHAREARTDSVSQQCSDTLTSITNSDEFNRCIPANSLAPIILIINDHTVWDQFLKDPAGTYKSILEQPFVEFANGMCPAPKCSDDDVNKAIKALQDGCKDEIESDPIIQFLYLVAIFYSPLRDSVCFKDGDPFCFDQSMLTVITLPPSPFPITGSDIVDAMAVADPSFCTKCNKDIINTFNNFLIDRKNKGDTLPFDVLLNHGIGDEQIEVFRVGTILKCGIQFLDGTTP